MTEIREINERIERESAFIELLNLELDKVIIGQRYMLDRLLIGMLANGHILLEGVPGLAKTLAIKSLSQAIDAQFSRLVYPWPITGRLNRDDDLQPEAGAVYGSEGSDSWNFHLAYEINRAPAKVQSALLEAMQERQLTIGDTTFALPEPFLVLATQNPVEQEGNVAENPSPGDRFMLKVVIDYPNKEEEKRIIRENLAAEFPKPAKVISPD